MFRQDVDRKNEATQCAASAQETDQGTAHNRLSLKEHGFWSKGLDY